MRCEEGAHGVRVIQRDADHLHAVRALFRRRSASSAGISLTHGPHQLAQTLIRTGRPAIVRGELDAACHPARGAATSGTRSPRSATTQALRRRAAPRLASRSSARAGRLRCASSGPGPEVSRLATTPERARGDRDQHDLGRSHSRRGAALRAFDELVRPLRTRSGAARGAPARRGRTATSAGR